MEVSMKADQQKVTRLLKTARGQIDGILRMVEEDRYCIDISNQMLRTQALLGTINAEVLTSHLDHCVRHAFESEFFGKFFSNGYVAVSVEFARIYVRIIRFDSENVFRFLFVCNAIIDI